MIETIDVPDVFGYTTFCDDLRFEVDHKVTLVGVYNGIMLVRSEFPITLPKFCVSVTFNQKRSIFVRELALRIFLPEDTDDQASIEADIQSIQESPLSDPDSERIAITANLVFSPFTINSAGAIKVRMLREGVLHRLGQLRVLESSPEKKS